MVRSVHVSMAFKATHYTWRGSNSDEGQSTFWTQFAAKSFTFCRRGNASCIRKLSGSNLGHGSSIQRSSCLPDTATPPAHDLKMYGARGGKTLMQIETAMDGGHWRSSGWPLYPTSFADGSIKAMVKNTQMRAPHCLCVHKYVRPSAMLRTQGRAWTAQALHANTLRFQEAGPRLLTVYLHPYFPHPPKCECWNISRFLKLFNVLWNFLLFFF